MRATPSAYPELEGRIAPDNAASLGCARRSGIQQMPEPDEYNLIRVMRRLLPNHNSGANAAGTATRSIDIDDLGEQPLGGALDRGDVLSEICPSNRGLHGVFAKRFAYERDTG